MGAPYLLPSVLTWDLAPWKDLGDKGLVPKTPSESVFISKIEGKKICFLTFFFFWYQKLCFINLMSLWT